MIILKSNKKTTSYNFNLYRISVAEWSWASAIVTPIN